VTVVAGIDEAGYGPRLGPLVSSAASYRLDVESGGADELWDLLEGVVGRPGRGLGERLAVGDSKKLYSGATGLDALEGSLLAFLAASGCAAATPEELAGELLSDRCRDSLTAHPWYRARGEGLPLSGSQDRTAAMAARLCECCARKGVLIRPFRSRLLAEGEFNRRVELLDNKATVLIGLVIELLRELRTGAGSDALSVFVDRLGGRTDYSGVLSGAFPGAFVWEQERSAQCQAYVIEGLAGPTRVEFRTRADSSCFPVALASMTSKYLREIFMRRFNAYWVDLDPQIPTTSGYYADAGSFLEAASALRRRMGIEDGDLVRSR